MSGKITPCDQTNCSPSRSESTEIVFHPPPSGILVRDKHRQPRAGVDGVARGRSPQSQDHASQGRTGDDRNVTLRALQRQGLHQLRARHQARDQGLTRRLFERSEKCQEHGRDVEHMRRGLTGKSQQSQKSRNAEQAQLGAHHQLAPIHRVGEQPTDEQQRDLRQRARDAEQTDLQRRVGQFIDLPGHRHRSELRADAGQKRAGPEHTKVAMTQQRKPALVVIHSSIN